MSVRTLALAAALAVSAAPVGAAAIPVPYSGSYDEAAQAPSGDYDAIGGSEDIGSFRLLAGDNVFLGRARTPDDSTDQFFLEVAAGFRLTGARLEWGLNASELNPMRVLDMPVWALETGDGLDTLLQVGLGGNWAEGPLAYQPDFAPRGPGFYNMTLGNGVFALYDNSPIAYRLTFTVERTDVPPPPVPEPAALGLLGLGVLGVAALRRRRT